MQPRRSATALATLLGAFHIFFLFLLIHFRPNVTLKGIDF